MKVLVTGATGFVASHLIPALLTSGHDVVACGHDQSRLAKYPEASRCVVDLRDRNLTGHLPTRIDAVKLEKLSPISIGLAKYCVTMQRSTWGASAV